MRIIIDKDIVTNGDMVKAMFKITTLKEDDDFIAFEVNGLGLTRYIKNTKRGIKDMMTLDEAIEHSEEVAREHERRLKVYENLDEDRPLFKEEENACKKCAEEHRQLAAWLTELKQLREQMSSSEKSNKWIPLISRPMTEEEREEYKGMAGITENMILNCPLPDDGQEVFVSYGDYVCIDTFHDDDGCYFEDVEIDEVDAWMPLPPSYKAERENKND